jgi:hypothetical protein
MAGRMRTRDLARGMAWQSTGVAEIARHTTVLHTPKPGAVIVFALALALSSKMYCTLVLINLR